MVEKRIAEPLRPSHTSISSYYVTIVVMVALLTVNFLFWQIARNRTFELSKSAFIDKTNHITSEANDMIDEYGEIANQGKALFTVNPDLDRRQFETYFGTILQNKNSGYKAISAILYAEHVDKAADFVTKVRADHSVSREGYPFFTIFPDATTPLTIVNYIQPFEEHKDLFGYNISSDNQQARVFTAAHLSREVRVSDILTFLNRKRSAVYQPIMKEGPTHTLLGYLILLIDPDVFFQQLAELTQGEMSMKVYKGTLSVKDLNNPDNIVYYGDDIPAILEAGADKGAYVSVGHVDAGGVPMTFAFTSNRDRQLTWSQKTLLNTLLYGGSITIFIMFGVVSYVLFAKEDEAKNNSA